LIGEYDEIELPPVKPFVWRHRRYALRCTSCGQPAPGPSPAVATGTPFGPRIHALSIYLKSVQALSYERLRKGFLDMFGLVISEGAIMNMFKRKSAAFEQERGKALEIVRKADFVASDETGMRIEGVNGYQWVFHCNSAVVHAASFTRAPSVVPRRWSDTGRKSGVPTATARSRAMVKCIRPAWRI
jgi:transposase